MCSGGIIHRGFSGNEPEIVGYTDEEEDVMYTEMCSEHSAMVSRLAKPGEEIVASMTDDKADLLHMVLGIAGEAGELVDAVKKHVIYGKPLDLENVLEELGDLEFYLEGLRQNLGMGRGNPLEHNLIKLNQRYPHGTFSDEQAIARADKG